MRYTLADELKIDGLLKMRIRDLHDEINHSLLSDRQKELSRKRLQEYQELKNKNRMIRQLNILRK